MLVNHSVAFTYAFHSSYLSAWDKQLSEILASSAIKFPALLRTSPSVRHPSSIYFISWTVRYQEIHRDLSVLSLSQSSSKEYRNLVVLSPCARSKLSTRTIVLNLLPS